MTCTIPGCTEQSSKRGLCNRHYLRVKRHGDPNYVAVRRYDAGEQCAVEDCTSSPFSLGYCRSHYERDRNYGSPTGTPRRRTVAERFWQKVDRSSSPNGCWNWTGTTTRAVNGYGAIRVDGRMQVAHRIAYQLLVGPIPDGLDLDHRCRNRLCVNVAHLEPVTAFVNFSRGHSAPAANSRKTHCKRGHLLSGENLAIENGGRSRRCRQCKRDASRTVKTHGSQSDDRATDHPPRRP